MAETAAQQSETGMQTKPQKEHAWLQRLVGEWTWETQFPAGPGHEAGCQRGTEQIRALGDLWIVAEGEGDGPMGAPMSTLITFGYDPVRKRFVGTWLSSTMAYLWLCEGTLDQAERTLTLEAVGPSFETEGEICSYRDVIELHSDDHRTLTAYYQGKDGDWRQMMVTHYRRAS